MKLFFWFLLGAFILVFSVLFFIYIIDSIGKLFTCTFLTSEVEDVNIEAKLYISVKRGIHIPTCFEWMQAPCSIKLHLPGEIKLENAEIGKTYSICGKVKGSNVVKCYSFDVYWYTNGTILPGNYEVVVGEKKVYFNNRCNPNNQISAEVCEKVC
ncbi:MAG: hypothetical protein RMJ17_01615 [Candidatus Aenigmarchaeota archaeon]|nr:hypothetical protein [Candidatus Aenigmarchaeota archaeon]MDW8149275.1 hypothetical protein [Candidatus Aenigmarchaeota archaeon]